MPHILVVIGTRPEAIKMLPVIKAIRSLDTMRLTVVVTGQHREMLEPAFRVFDETYDINLDIMQPAQTLAQVTATILTEMSDLLARTQPDMVLVHGDTTTAFSAALAAFYARIRVGHVEAGLRSADMDNPWPEEFNRIAIDSFADMMFAPTEVARANLHHESNASGDVFVTGNTGIDALQFVAHRLDTSETLRDDMHRRYSFLDDNARLVLVTGHRRESFGDGFEGICDGIIELARRKDVQIVYPVHLNPQVRETVMTRLRDLNNVFLIEPVDYIDIVYLMQRALFVMTDSGGIQEEAPALGRPVLVLRDVTERPEGITEGVVRLVGTDPAAIVAQASLLLDDPQEYARRARAIFPYGDGEAAPRIADLLSARLS